MNNSYYELELLTRQCETKLKTLFERVVPETGIELSLGAGSFAVEGVTFAVAVEVVLMGEGGLAGRCGGKSSFRFSRSAIIALIFTRYGLRWLLPRIIPN